MMDIQIQEILILVIVALLAFGAFKLPAFARLVAGATRNFRP